MMYTRVGQVMASEAGLQEGKSGRGGEEKQTPYGPEELESLA